MVVFKAEKSIGKPHPVMREGIPPVRRPPRHVVFCWMLKVEDKVGAGVSDEPERSKQTVKSFR